MGVISFGNIRWTMIYPLMMIIFSIWNLVLVKLIDDIFDSFQKESKNEEQLSMNIFISYAIFCYVHVPGRSININIILYSKAEYNKKK